MSAELPAQENAALEGRFEKIKDERADITADYERYAAETDSSVRLPLWRSLGDRMEARIKSLGTRHAQAEKFTRDYPRRNTAESDLVDYLHRKMEAVERFLAEKGV